MDFIQFQVLISCLTVRDIKILKAEIGQAQGKPGEVLLIT